MSKEARTSPAVTLEVGKEAQTRFGSAAIAFMRREITETGDREVFFAGGTASSGLIEEVRVCARGHRTAVNAIFEGLAPRDVVVHNHPSSDITPSDADIELAHIYSRNGHGVYIVDNEVNRVYVVIEPFREKDRHRLDAAALARRLSPSGALARNLPKYEVRPQQTQMMEMVSAAFNGDGMAVIEAPTGVGKTVAYLLPAIEWALKNRERVVVSTRTINLQEQIVFKDIPILQKCVEQPFSAVLVKGRQNYLCPRRLERALSEATLFEDADSESILKAIAQWAEHTQDGSTSDLPFVPPREVWDRVCSEADTCPASQCQSTKNCFLARARREIAKADIIVVNHHMLFSDLAIKQEMGSFSSLAVLPAFERLILDEAHHVEDSATEYFGVDCTRLGALALLGRFVRRERGVERGLMPYIKIKLMEARHVNMGDLDRIFGAIDNAVLPGLASARGALETAFDALRNVTAERCGQIGREIRWRLTEQVLEDPALREIHNVYVMPAAEEVSRLAKQCAGLAAMLRELRPPEGEESPLAMELTQLNSYTERLLRLASALAEGTSAHLKENTVRWIEIDSQKASVIRIARCPLEVGKPLAEWVYPNLSTVVMTSATLSVEKSFDFLFQRIGLDSVVGRDVQCALLDSPFDYQQQAVLCVPGEGPLPDSPSFNEYCSELIDEVVRITQGHAFILFTSFSALNTVHNRLEKRLRSRGITALKQGSANRTTLLERFREDVSSVLFATDSFWEGVDVAGEALQCVIVPRLPFRVPTEPILQARAEAIDARNGNAFMEYTVPLAVIKFRQGIGRLIRRRSDRGSVVVLDSRILTKRYGRAFLESLPPMRVVTGARTETLEALRRFHSGTKETHQK